MRHSGAVMRHLSARTSIRLPLLAVSCLLAACANYQAYEGPAKPASQLAIIEGTAKQLGIPAEKAIITVHKYGNTSSASIPVALSEAAQEGRIPEGARLAICAFGGGLAWGSMILEWSTTGVAPARAELVQASARG